MAFLMSRDEAAAFLGISPTYFSVLVNDPKTEIPFVTLKPGGKGRKYYSKEALQEWLKSRMGNLENHQAQE